jgi:hypothetical protein
LCQDIQVLKLKKQKNYSEENILYFDSSANIIQDVTYNERYTTDEEYSIDLWIHIPHTSKALQLRKIDIIKDSAIAICRFEWLSVWHWGGENPSINGEIEILSLTDKSAEISFNLVVYRIRDGKNYIYSGRRVFKVTKDKPRILDFMK